LELDLRLEGELQAVVGDDLLIGLVDRVLHDIGHDRAAVEPAQMADRHLAGTEAIDLGLALKTLEAVIEPRLEVGGVQHHLKFALEALREGFGHVHRFRSANSSLLQCPKRDAGRPPPRSRNSHRTEKWNALFGKSDAASNTSITVFRARKGAR